jgi:phosphoglucosamine mutase
VYLKTGAAGLYTDFLIGRANDHQGLAGTNLVLDCANGATYAVAPKVFQALGARVQSIFCEPDGKNINDGCGSQHPETLARKVAESGAHAGLAFDGDGDRLIAVDETGQVLTGDQIIGICAKHWKDGERLRNNRVVTTVMSNIGLGLALDGMGVEHRTTAVGDRYVVKKMIQTDAVVGGENSGHMVFLEQHTTGDGILAAINLLEAMQQSGRPLSELKQVVRLFPQKLVNVEVTSKPSLDNIPELNEVIGYIEEKLGRRGRVLVRYSGTQPMCRIMVEGPTQAETEDYCQRIAAVIEEVLNKPVR